jgi:hypothetical protein
MAGLRPSGLQSEILTQRKGKEGWRRERRGEMRGEGEERRKGKERQRLVMALELLDTPALRKQRNR